MKKRKNYYQEYGLAADYSKPERVAGWLSKKLLDDGQRFVALKEATLPAVGDAYPLAQIENENQQWWPTHCEALRCSRSDILVGEYRADLAYLCQDGPYHGLEEQKSRERHWWALLAQPGVTMTWPIVMFAGELVWFEWSCLDDETHEVVAKGSVAWLRRGHRGGCYTKGEQLTFYRDVYAPDELLNLLHG
jgi:hypothetical protein